MSTMVVFINRLKSNQETEDKLEILAKEEGSGDVDFSPLPDGNVMGSASFPLKSEAESFKKKVKSFAGISAAIVEG